MLQREFGFKLERRAILVDDLRVRASGRHTELPEAEQEPADAGGRAECVGREGGGQQQMLHSFDCCFGLVGISMFVTDCKGGVWDQSSPACLLTRRSPAAPSSHLVRLL